MACSSDTPTIEESTNEKKGPEFSKNDLKTIAKASTYAVNEGNKLSGFSDEVKEKNFLQMWWDSKVPKDEKGLISFSSSDRKVIQQEIEKFKTFYTEMKTTMKDIQGGEKGGIENIEETIDKLFAELDNLSEVAESGEKTTSSTMLCKLYKDFGLKHDRLENMIRRVESAGLRQKQKVMQEKWEKSLDEVKTLTEGLKEAKSDKEEMKKCMEELKKDNQKSREQQERLLEEHKKITDMLQILLNRLP